MAKALKGESEWTKMGGCFRLVLREASARIDVGWGASDARRLPSRWKQPSKVPALVGWRMVHRVFGVVFKFF